MLIGLLLAGQHTSSTTSAWMGFFMAKDRSLQDRCYAEQKAVCGEALPPLDFDQVRLGAMQVCGESALSCHKSVPSFP